MLKTKAKAANVPGKYLACWLVDDPKNKQYSSCITMQKWNNAELDLEVGLVNIQLEKKKN